MKRLISIFTSICMLMTVGCFTASAADETVDEELSALDYSSNIVIGDSSELTVVDADEIKFETHDEDDADPGVSPRVTVVDGCASCIKRIIVWPAYYDSTNKTIRYREDVRAYYTWAEATEYGGALNVPTSDTRILMQAFYERTNYPANAWRMETTFNIYSDYNGSYPEYYEFTPSSNCLGNRTANGKVRFECSRKPGHQSVYLTTSFSAPTDYTNQPELSLRGNFYYYNKTAKTLQNRMSYARTRFNQ